VPRERRHHGAHQQLAQEGRQEVARCLLSFASCRFALQHSLTVIVITAISVHKALKQAYRSKILHLEASITDLRVRIPCLLKVCTSFGDADGLGLQKEGEVATRPATTNAPTAVAANIIRGVGVGVGVVTDVKKEPKF
jgi:hypothetical protein